MLGDGLDGLSEALLAAWLDVLPKKELQAGLRRVAGLLAGAVEAGQPLSKRLALTVERLNGLHYQARWEAPPQGALIWALPLCGWWTGTLNYVRWTPTCSNAARATGRTAEKRR
jgi:hypothetical protein